MTVSGPADVLDKIQKTIEKLMAEQNTLQREHTKVCTHLEKYKKIEHMETCHDRYEQSKKIHSGEAGERNTGPTMTKHGSVESWISISSIQCKMAQAAVREQAGQATTIYLKKEKGEHQPNPRKINLERPLDLETCGEKINWVDVVRNTKHRVYLQL